MAAPDAAALRVLEELCQFTWPADSLKSKIDGKTVVHTAAIRNNVEAMKIILQRVPASMVNEPDSLEQWTPLHYAMLGGFGPMVSLLIANGADRDAVSREITVLNGLGGGIEHVSGETPWDVAFHRPGCLAAVAAFLDGLPAGKRSEYVNRRLKNTKGMWALHVAAGNGDVDLINLLISNGAMISPITVYRATPLLEAASAFSCDSTWAILALLDRPRLYFTTRESMFLPLLINLKLDLATKCKIDESDFQRFKGLISPLAADPKSPFFDISAHIACMKFVDMAKADKTMVERLEKIKVQVNQI